MRWSLLILLLLSGCWAGGPRRPLFGGAPEPVAGPGSDPAPPVRPYQSTPEGELLLRLQRGNAEERAAAVEELVARGPEARDEVRGARDEALVLHDLLEGALARLEADGPRPAGPAPDVAWLEEQHGLAVDRFAHGDVWGALRLIDALLVIAPDAPVAPRLHALRRRAVVRLVQESLCRVELLPSAPALTPERPLAARLRLVNQGEERVELVAGDDGELGVLTLVYEEVAPAGGRTRTMVERTIRSPQDRIELEPGQSWELELQLTSPHKELPTGTVGRYQLGGRLRARSLLVGETRYSMFVPFLPGEVVVVESRDADLLGDPPGEKFLGALKAAHAAPREARAEAARRVFVAGLVLARADRDLAVAALAESLSAAEGSLAEAICAALSRATGEPRTRTPEEWLRWWASERRARPGQ